MKNVQTKLQNQKGFTLVEIAIVLVIIGLLLGGVLKGQELIENSKVKSVTQDFDNIAAAYWAYKDRTGTYPTNFFGDLRAEGFITGASGDASGPDHALDGVFSYVASGTTTGAQKELCASNIEGSIAQNIDTKLDDGVQNTGSVRGSAAYTAGTYVTLCKELM